MSRRKSVQCFSGFPDGKVETVTLPALVFSDLILQIDDLDELKVTLLVLVRLTRLRADVAPWVSFDELVKDAEIQAALGERNFEARLESALERAVARGTLLTADRADEEASAGRRYFANSPKGRAAVAAIRRGATPVRAPAAETRVNIFTLYEENIGPLTSLISEDLMEAEETYPADWIEEAVREAVRLNKRSWKYIHAILERWQTEGKDEVDRRPNRRDREEAARRYIREQHRRILEE